MATPQLQRDLVYREITAGPGGLIYDEIFSHAVHPTGGKGDNPPGQGIFKPTGLLESRQMSRAEVREEVARLLAKKALDDQEAEMLCLLMLLLTE